MSSRVRVVHIRKKPRYLLCSNSAITQSTMCGLGVMIYMASMSRWVVRRCSMRSISGGSEAAANGNATQRTGDVGVEDVIFFDHIVDQLLAVLVDNQYLPLRGVLAVRVRVRGARKRTSPRVVARMVLRMTVQRQWDSAWCECSRPHTLFLDLDHGSTHRGHVGGVWQPMARVGADAEDVRGRGWSQIYFAAVCVCVCVAGEERGAGGGRRNDVWSSWQLGGGGAARCGRGPLPAGAPR